MGGGDDPGVDRDGARASQPLDLALFQHAQELDLHFGRQVADLVEKDRRVVRQLESADLARQRPGERAFLPPEQLAFDERRRNRSAVDPHHRPPLAASEFVDLRCEEFLSGSRFPEQEHRGVGGRYLPDLLQYPPDGRALPDDAGQPQPFSLFQSQVDVLGVQLIFEPLHFTRRREHRLVTLLPRQDLLEHAREDLEAMHDLRRPAFARRGSC